MDFIYLYQKNFVLAKEDRWKIVLYTLLHTISIIANVLQPMAFAMVINKLQQQQADMMTGVAKWLGIYVLCFYVFELCHRSARHFELSTAYHNKQRFILNTYERLQALPLEWHVDHHSGNVISRVNKAGDAIYSFGLSVYEYITAIVTFVGSVYVLARISFTAAVIALIAGVLVVVSSKKWTTLEIREYSQLNQGFYKIAATFQDGLSNITTIILLRLGGCIYKDLKQQFDGNYKYMMGDNHYSQIKCHINSLIEVMLNVGVVFYYINCCQKNGSVVMLGAVTAIFQYLNKIMESFWFYATDYTDVIQWRVDYQAVGEIFAGVNETPDEEEELPILKNWKCLKIGPVNFSYGENQLQLKNLYLKLQMGKRIAFVGESGSGKSTMLKIIRGVCNVPGCQVEVDEKMTIDLSALSKITTLIPQEPEIFDHSVRYNITMGVSATEQEVEQAAWLSKFDEVITKLPNGLESGISENGVNLSGGEKQRLALARGVFSIQDSKIILLDEPTGSLDPATELAVYQRLLEQYPERCVISVLHRLHLLPLFDEIYVFQDGAIVEHGTFDQLVKANKQFTFLWEQYQMERI